MTVNTEVATQESKEVTAQAHQEMLVKQAMADMGVSSSDLIPNKLFLMQNTSEAVGEELAKFGDIVTGDNEKVGGLGEPIEIIPLKVSRTLMTYDLSGPTPKFMRKEVLTPKLDALPWEGIEADTPVRRIKTYDWAVILKKELLAGEAFPTIISFKRTSLKAGEKIASNVFKWGELGQLPYSRSVELLVRKDKKDTNYYAVFDIGKTTKLDEVTEMPGVYRWIKALETRAIVSEVDQEDVEVGGRAYTVAVAPTVMGSGTVSF